MSATERYKQLDLLAEDAITDAVEEMYFKGVITLEEKSYLYEKIGKGAKLEGILSFDKASKKEQIKRKLDPKSKNYAYKPVKLPGASSMAKTMKWATGRIFKRA